MSCEQRRVEAGAGPQVKAVKRECVALFNKVVVEQKEFDRSLTVNVKVEHNHSKDIPRVSLKKLMIYIIHMYT